MTVAGREPGTALRLPLVLLAAAVLLFAFLGRKELANPDEPRDAETAREVPEWRSLALPEINGTPFTERPPLFYFGVHAVFRTLGGPTDFNARVFPALMGLLAVYGVWLAGESLLGRGKGWLPAILVLGLPYFLLKFRTCLTDTGLAGFTTLSLGLFFAAWKRNSPRLAAAAGVAAGLAFLCKGLLGLGIPALAAGGFLVARRDLHAVLRLRLWVAVLTGVAVLLPWIVSLHAARGWDGLYQFFVVQHFGRLGADADHARPPWYYVNALWILLPATPLLAAGLLSSRRLSVEERDAVRAGATWVGVPLLVLMAISGKRGVYLVPLLPGAALAAAAVLEAATGGRLGPRCDAIARTVDRWTRFLPSLPFLGPETRDLRTRAGTAALALGALTVVYQAGWEASLDDRMSARVMSRRAAEEAGTDPLILFRVGEGSIGPFTFALRRKLDVAWREPRILELAGPGRAVIVAEKQHWEEAIAGRQLSPELLATIRFVDEVMASGHPFLLLERAAAPPPR